MKDLRIRKFLIALDDYFNFFSYYDDETDETVIDGDEQECYNVLMQNDEFHLLGEKTVRELIHIGFTDYEQFFKLQRKYNAFA